LESMACYRFAVALLLVTTVLNVTHAAGDGVGDSVAKTSMEANAAAMLADEERSEEMLRRESAADDGPDLGESVADDDDPPAPWDEEQKKQKMQNEQRKDEMRIQANMDEFDGKVSVPKRVEKEPSAPQPAVERATQGDLGESADVESKHGDLGESADVESQHGDLGESAQVESKVAASDANTLTARAQAHARAQNKVVEKNAAINRAKQIAEKVRNLVQQQQHLEDVSGHQVGGSVLGQARAEADKASDMSARDELLAHKLEDEQAEHTMQHLIETERQQQRKVFEQERETTHTLLQSVKSKLHHEQKKMVNQVRRETTSAVLDVEHKLSQTKLAQTIEEVVKKKLAKRLQELQGAGQQTVHDVAAQMGALKRRVTRLRKDQERMKRSESSMERNFMSTSHSQEQDLGESASVGGNAIAQQLQQMQLQQMARQQMMSMQSPMQTEEHQELMRMKEQMAEMRRARHPIQSPMQTEEHQEMMRMKEEMEAMRKQNQLLQELASNQVSTRFAHATAPKPVYTQHGLHKYFQHRRQDVDSLKQGVLAERQRLEELTSKLQAVEADPDAAEESSGLPGSPQMLLELGEGMDMPESASAVPLYNERAEQARVDMEDMQRQAFEDALASQSFGE